jgi:hypothetical protein
MHAQAYANLFGEGKLSRRENLRENWGFDCGCARCQHELSGPRPAKALKSEARAAIEAIDAAPKPNKPHVSKFLQSGF